MLGRTHLLSVLSAGGAVSGQSLLAPPTTDEIDYNDADIRAALRWRLGVAVPPGLCRCEPRSGGDRCGADVHADGVHCLSCMIGPARYALHHAIADKVCTFCAEAGAQQRREVFVPEFLHVSAPKKGSDDDEPHRKAGILDVWAFGTVDIQDLLIDVTFRNAAAPRYAPQAAQREGAAARRPAEEEQQRYPPSGGRRATCFALESWGRLGTEGEALLLTLRAAADRRDQRTGHTQVGRFARWRRQLDSVVQHGIVRCLQASLVGLPGRAHCRGPK